MSEFKDEHQLREPKVLTAPRFISAEGQLSVEEAKKIAEKHGVVWGD